MSSVTGIISDIEQRSVTTRFGAKTSYTLVVNGVKYGAGFKHPGVSVGTMVTFEHKDDPYRSIIGSVLPAATPAAPGSAVPPAAAPAKTAYSSGGREKPFPIPPLHGDRSIIRQNSLTNARELYSDLSAYVDNGGVMKSLDVCAAEIIALARRFEAYSCGDIDREEAMASKAMKELMESEHGS